MTILTGNEKNNKLEGGDGDDELWGLGGDDHLKGGGGNDSLYGGDGNDHLDGDDGDDFLSGGDGKDKLHGKDGNDTIEGGAGDDELHGDDGDDTLIGGDGEDKLEGKDGNDVLEGGLGEDHVKGGDGDDEIIWRAGDGEDKLDGGKGEDTFSLTSSDSVKQTILLTSNKRGDLVVVLDGDSEGGELELKNIENFNLQIGAAGASLQIGDLPAGGIGDKPLTLTGGDGGDVIDATGSTKPIVVKAGAGDDSITGGEAADVITGGGGADVITGRGGDDIIDAGVGDDKVIWKAGNGNDVISGGEGTDTADITLHATQPSSLSISADAAGNVILTAEDGTRVQLDEIEEIIIKAGAAGTTITIGDLTGTDVSQNTLYFVGGAGNDNFDASISDRRIVATGGAGNDVLRSGSGNDLLDGGAGNDILNAGSGAGIDTVLGGAGDDLIISTMGDDFDGFAVDIVDGGADNDQLDVIFIEPTNYDLFFTVSSNGDGSFRITSHDNNLNETLNVSNVETLRLVSGEGALNLTLNTLSDTSLSANGVSFQGSTEADFLNGANTDVVINGTGGAGDDTVIGGSQDDHLFGGAGNDSLSGNGGNDILVGEAGNDIMDGGDGHDKADYSAATGGVTVDLGSALQQNTVSAGLDTLVNIEEVIGSNHADILKGGSGNDTLRGGAGNDQLSGGDGFDMLFGGSGDDTLSDSGSLDPLSGDAGNDIIDGVASYYNDPSAVIANFSDAAVTVGGVTVAARSARDGYGDTDTFSAASRNLQGSNFADHVTGSDVGQGFYSRDGNDQLFGLGGDDIFRGGRGNDSMDGGDGFDFADYRDDATDGAPTQGINVNLVTGAATDGFGHSDSLTSIEGIYGTSLADTIVGDANNNTLLAQGGDDNVSGGAGNDFLGGWSGNDTLAGDAGNDIIMGDTGNDTLSGSSGADTYRFDTFAGVTGSDFGHDTISDFDVAEDVLNVSNLGISTLFDVTDIATESAGNTVITIDAERSITLIGVSVAQLADSNFIFADPGLNEGTEGDDVWTGTESADFFRGLGGNDTLNGLGGNDVLIGDEGNDQLFGGEGDDTLLGKADNDTLDGGAGNDNLDGGDGIDTVSYALDPAGVTVNLQIGTATDGTGGTDNLISTDPNVNIVTIENIVGSAFSDSLTGDDGSNTINGDGPGAAGAADTIYGMGGLDRILPGFGIDTVDGGDGTDIVYFWSEGMQFGDPGITITFQGDGSITMSNPVTGDIETAITNVEGVVGTLGIDTITGNDQDNIIRGYWGADILDGGLGSDTVWYFSGGRGMTVDLGAGISYFTREQSSNWYNDTLSNFENVLTGQWDDVLIGDGNDNILEGANGDDTFIGGAGNDFLNGGQSTIITDIGSDDPAENGFDVADYSNSPGAITANLITNQASDGWGGTDTFNQIDGVTGSAYNDIFIGNDDDNEFQGLQGDDTYTLGAGSDGVVLSDDGYNNANFGLDTVTDFNANEDVIDVGAFSNISNISQLNISQDGNGLDTLITFDASNVLRLLNVTATALTAANFSFAISQTIIGTESNDFLEGGDGNDTIRGLGGNDQLFGHKGDDDIDGGSGFDNLYGGGGNDVLDGGGDFDNIYGEGGDDILNSGGRGGNLYGGEGNDTLTGTSDGSKLSGILDGGPGNDTLIEPEGRMTLFGGPGDDTLDGRVSYTGDPAGVFVNLEDTAWDVFGNGNTLVPGRSAFDGWGDTDTLAAGVINGEFSNFDDFVQGDDFAQWFNLLAGDDTAYGGLGNNNFNPGSGNDTIYGSDEWDHLSFWDHHLDAAGASFKGVVVNLSSTDFDYGGPALAIANTVEDNYGDTDTVFKIDGVSGTDFDDVLIGSEIHNNFSGGAGNDKLYGGDVSGDWLSGGAGNDWIDGQGGDDTATYWDVVHGINVDLSLGTAADDGNGNVDTLVSIENIEGSRFDDIIIGDANRNTIWTNDGNDYVEAGAGDDNLDNREGDDQLFGQDGRDYFQAGAGNNLIDGGNDEDTVNYAAWRGTTSGINVNLTVIDGGAPYANVSSTPNGFGGTDYLRSIENIEGTDYNDTIIGDANNNRFQGYVGNDFLSGGDGDDQLYGADDNDTLDGGAGNDRLDGGENDDNLTGGTGNDRFVFSRTHFGPNSQQERVGFGDDIITDFSITDDTLDVYNVPEFTSVTAMLSYRISDLGAPDLVLKFISNDNVAGIDELNQLTLVGITPADLANMNISFAPIAGTEGDDVLTGTADNDYIRGFGGNDVIYGGAGNDSLHGDDGNDQLFGEDGHDWLNGGKGDDLIDGGAGPDSDHVNFDDGSNTYTGVTVDLSATPVDVGDYTGVIVVSNDGSGGTDYLRNVSNVSGTNFDDTLIGGTGHNYLEGRAGNDVLRGGDDNDSLYGGDGNDQLFGDDGHDFLRGGKGDDLIDGGASSDPDHVNFDDGSNTVTGVNVDLSAALVDAGGYTGVVVVSNDGTGGTDYLRNVSNVSGTNFADTLTGGGEDNNLQGQAGDDVLNGGGGNDWLQGGIDNDDLTGGSGNDNFVLTRNKWDPFSGNVRTGFGDDIINDFSVTNDTLDVRDVPEFTNIAAMLSYVISAPGADLVLEFTSTDGPGSAPELNRLTLTGITEADLPNMNIWFAPIEGTPGPDVLNGTVYDDYIRGLGGDDVIHGDQGNDNLNGDDDNDQVFGDAGSDFLSGGNGDDELHGGADNDNLYGNNGNDQLFGDADHDWLRGGAGDDLLDGGDGQDYADFNDGSKIGGGGVTVDLSAALVDAGGYTGVIVVADDGTGGTDYLKNIENVSGTAFSDILTGGVGNNALRGNDGDDLLHGGDDNDYLDGGSGNDELFGDAGNDGLNGGAGDDLIDGGAGDDTADFWNSNGTGGVNVDLTAAAVTAGGYTDVIVVADDGSGGTDYLRGIEHLRGTKFGDTFTGGAGHNNLWGSDGDDTLNGGADNDYLDGGEGNDTLIAAGNNDYLRGSGGDDLFVLSDGMNVTIGDFTAGEASEDVINLAGVSALTDFDDVTAAANDSGGQVQIDLDGTWDGLGTNIVTLVGVTSIANLHGDDFSFI